jgi:DNA-binding PadR family transcriptional regulator
MFYDDHRSKMLFMAHGGHGDWGHRRHGGGGFGGWGGGGRMPGSRKLSAADLQLVILALLEQKPAHGYELIRSLEERSGGFYAPSPGVIYPALTYLDEIGRAAAEAEGNRKLYRITDAGREHLAARRTDAEAILDALSRIGGRMDQVREAFAGLSEPDAALADEARRAFHALKHAVMHKRGSGPEEMRRITEILQRAAAEILKEK